MRYYKINRSIEGGGIFLGPTKQEYLKGILMCYSSKEKCNPFNWPHEDEWISLGFIDLTHPEVDWGYVLLSNGKTSALEGFYSYLRRLGIGNTDSYESFIETMKSHKLYQKLMTVTLDRRFSSSSNRSWYTYAFHMETSEVDILDLIAKVAEANRGNLPPLLNPDPKVTSYFSCPITTEVLTSLIYQQEATMITKETSKLVTPVTDTFEVEESIYLDRMKGISWD